MGFALGDHACSETASVMDPEENVVFLFNPTVEAQSCFRTVVKRSVSRPVPVTMPGTDKRHIDNITRGSEITTMLFGIQEHEITSI